jgi:hypothetical protein
LSFLHCFPNPETPPIASRTPSPTETQTSIALHHILTLDF